jgi:ABC-type thiamine transport system ATPase subunit
LYKNFRDRTLGWTATQIDHAVECALDLVGMRHEADSYPFVLGRGQRQKLAIASVIAMGSPVIVVDEPTTGHDLRGVRAIMDLLCERSAQGHTDALASMIGSEFTGPGDQKPFVADWMNRDKGLIYTANAPDAVGAKESAKMDFTHADQADARKLNVILWKDAMGTAPVPAQLLVKQKKAEKDDDD